MKVIKCDNSEGVGVYICIPIHCYNERTNKLLLSYSPHLQAILRKYGDPDRNEWAVFKPDRYSLDWYENKEYGIVFKFRCEAFKFAARQNVVYAIARMGNRR